MSWLIRKYEAARLFWRDLGAAWNTWRGRRYQRALGMSDSELREFRQATIDGIRRTRAQQMKYVRSGQTYWADSELGTLRDLRAQLKKIDRAMHKNP